VIIVPLFGGLGNQMFQYAFLRAASSELDRMPVMDLTVLPTGRSPYRRYYELGSFSLHPTVRRLGLTSDQRDGFARKTLMRAGDTFRRSLSRVTVHEDLKVDRFVDFETIPSLLSVCSGYWQSHRYFENIADAIRKELTPRIDARGRVSSLLSLANGRETITVHVRRGDYASNDRIRQVHGVLSASYFRRGVRRIVETLTSSPLAIVLSDDPEWAAENLSLDIETVHAELEFRLSTVDSLALMSRTQHHVLANSTFSWWGAWLAEHPNQHVIYPEPWFASRSVDETFRFPKKWQSQAD